jgi:hypothetical protein
VTPDSRDQKDALLTRKEVRDRAEQLVAELLGGTLAPVNTEGWDLVAPSYGRVQVRARSRASKHLNWFHIRNVDRHSFDYLALVELEADGSVGGAWGMSWAQVSDYAHSVARDRRGGLVTKLAVRGSWKQRVDQLLLGQV